MIKKILTKGPSVIYSAIKTRTQLATGRLPEIEWVNFEITDACNSRCRHCNIWKQKPTQNLLTVKEIEKLFSDPLLKNIKGVIITGGEYVLRRDIKEAILAIHRGVPKARISLSDNALLPDLSVEVVKFAIENNIMIDMGISLDGIGKDHDYIRGRDGNFEKVDYFIDELKKLKKKYKNRMGDILIGHTLSNLTLKTLKSTYDYAQRKQVNFLTQMFDEAPFYYNVGREKEIGAFDNSEQFIKAIGQLPSSIHNEILIEILKNKKIKFNCFSLSKFFFLKCNGDISPCLRYSDKPIGNLKEKSFSEIWLSATAKERRRLVNGCHGCSNTWATGWSMLSDFLPFSKSIAKYVVKTAIAPLNIKRK